MGLIGKIIGGGLGFMVAGPVGAAVGASLGAIADKVAEDDPDDAETGVSEGESTLRVDAQDSQDEIGSFHSFVIHSALPREAFAVFHLTKPRGAWVQAVEGHCDNDGDYVGTAPIVDGRCCLYIPHIALKLKRIKQLSLHMFVMTQVDSEPQVVGVKLFDFRANQLGPYSRVALLRPLIDVCMAVAQADGHLDTKEVRLIKELFVNELEIPPAELTALRDAMKAPVVDDIEAAVLKTLLRNPGLTRADVLEFAARVAHADGEVSPAEVAVIRRVAGEVTARVWDEIVEALSLQTVDHHAVLGVAPGASAAEIKRAYRAMVTQYHPDRVSSLPQEFQRLAEQKTIELRAAYEALLARCDGPGVRGVAGQGP